MKGTIRRGGGGLKRKWYGYALLMTVLLAVSWAGSLAEQGAAQPAAVEGGGEKLVALTFDDGPAPTTEALLEGLRARDVRATFFVVGCNIPGREELLLRMAAAGHQIGQHTYSHVALEGQSRQRFLQELRQTDALLRQFLGEGDYWLRPPYGLIDEGQTALVETPLITWTVDPQDWKLLDAAQVTQAVLETVESGDVILLHDIYESSVEAALRIVDALLAQGYRFVTVRELMELQGVTPAAGELYRSPTRPGRGW